MTYFDNAFILFGGYQGIYNKHSNMIARLDLATEEWSKIGELRTVRGGHGVIYDGEFFMVIGGYDNRYGSIKTEKCKLSGKEFNSELP